MQEVVFQIRINDSKTTFILYSRLQAKTTRYFEENDTLFLGKRRVVEEVLSNNNFISVKFRRIRKSCDTCDSKKAKIPIERARIDRARTRVSENHLSS